MIDKMNDEQKIMPGKRYVIKQHSGPSKMLPIGTIVTVAMPYRDLWNVCNDNGTFDNLSAEDLELIESETQELLWRIKLMEQKIDILLRRV